MSGTLLSVVESPAHPNFSTLYRRLGFEQAQVNSIRKAISQLRQQPPDLIIAEFFYGYGNNYAGVNVSNLDVLLSSLPKYAPNGRVIVMVHKREFQFVERLAALFPVHEVLVHPVREPQMEAVLNELMDAG